MDDRGGRESGCEMCHLTDHAVQRTKERVGLPKRSAEKNAQKALESGIRHCETKGSLNRYITALYWKHIKGFPVLEYCIRQYNDFLDSFDFLEEVKEDAMVVSDVASLAQWEEAKIHILLRPEYAMMGISLNEAEEGVLLNIYSYFIREHLRKRREGKE